MMILLFFFDEILEVINMLADIFDDFKRSGHGFDPFIFLQNIDLGIHIVAEITEFYFCDFVCGCTDISRYVWIDTNGHWYCNDFIFSFFIFRRCFTEDESDDQKYERKNGNQNKNIKRKAE